MRERRAGGAVKSGRSCQSTEASAPFSHPQREGLLLVPPGGLLAVLPERGSVSPGGSGPDPARLLFRFRLRFGHSCVRSHWTPLPHPGNDGSRGWGLGPADNLGGQVASLRTPHWAVSSGGPWRPCPLLPTAGSRCPPAPAPSVRSPGRRPGVCLWLTFPGLSWAPVAALLRAEGHQGLPQKETSAVGWERGSRTVGESGGGGGRG